MIGVAGRMPRSLPHFVCANCRAEAAACQWNRDKFLAAWTRKNPINNGLLRRSKLEFFQKLREATSPGYPPALHLREYAREREGRQIKAQRFQDAGQNRLPAGAVDRLVGAARLARLRRTTQGS